MEEIALVFSSLAGACTAVALDKIPKRKYKQTVAVNSAVENQLHSLKIEKDILTKTITRLYHDESNVSKVHRDKLLIRYQHQLGTTIAKIESLETAGKYPDLGPIGDSLATLMDSKLSKLDQRLHEISSKISVNMIQPATQTTGQPVAQTIIQPEVRHQEKPKQNIQERQIEKVEPEVQSQQERTDTRKEKTPAPTPLIEIPSHIRHRSIELSTLTEIPSTMPEFPAEIVRPPQVHVESAKIIEEPIKKIHDVSQSIVPVEPAPLVPREEIVDTDTPEPETMAQIEKKTQLPTPIKIPEEEKIEDDDKDLDKIKSEIMKALSKLEQVEVE